MEFYFLGDMGSGEIYQYLVSSAIEKHIKEECSDAIMTCKCGKDIK